MTQERAARGTGLVALSAAAGIAALLLHHLVFGTPEPRDDSYYYSNYAVQNYTWVTVGLFAVTGVLIGYMTKANPFIIGFSTVLVFPVIPLGEAFADMTSHNLIPFELATHAVFAVPAIAGAYLGQYLAKRREG